MTRRAALITLLALSGCGRTGIDVYDTIGAGDDDTTTLSDTDDVVALLPSAVVPQGTFIMGSPATEACREPWSSKETAHQAQITYDYAMLTTEVTQAQWQSLIPALPAAQAVTCADCPVVNVTWTEAASFCNALSAGEGRSACYDCSSGSCDAIADILTCDGWRLPSEAEWERARRGGASGSLYTTDVVACDRDPALDDLAWYIGTTPGAPQTVQAAAQKAANPFGLFDMTGNAWEWCEDWQQVDLGAASVVDPLLDTPTSFRTSRGGGYGDRAEQMRAAARDSNPPASRFDYLGFRCARHL